ncbi:hypothetical protein HDU97_005347 [Phlyctochytrium planicorne]|nr:hypothetical protein HDU97_005347 [Phlyctochytrium planicorne]
MFAARAFIHEDGGGEEHRHHHRKRKRKQIQAQPQPSNALLLRDAAGSLPAPGGGAPPSRWGDERRASGQDNLDLASLRVSNAEGPSDKDGFGSSPRQSFEELERRTIDSKAVDKAEWDGISSLGTSSVSEAEDDLDDNVSDSWQTSSTVSMSSTSHAWIQDLVRLSKRLSKWRAILFLVRRIGNNVPPKPINPFSIAISFAALATDVRERLFELGIRTHLDLVNLIIISRLIFSVLMGALFLSIILLCVFTVRDVERSSFLALEILFSLDAACIILFTLEIMLHINAIPSKIDRQLAAEDRSSKANAKNPYPAYPWFVLMLRPSLKNSTATIATLAVIDNGGNSMYQQSPITPAPPNEVRLNMPSQPTSFFAGRRAGPPPSTPPLINNPASPVVTGANLNASFAALAPPAIQAAQARDVIKHHSLADPGWYWLAFDILATFPFYFELSFAAWYTSKDNTGFQGTLKSMYGWTGLPPALWILRLFRVFRVFKFIEKSEKMRIMTRAFIHSMDGIWLLLILMPVLLVLFSFGIFFAEQTGEYLDQDGFWRYRVDDSISAFQSVPDTFWFVIVTLTTICVMFCSIFIIAFPLSMITMQYAHVVRSFADRARRQEELTYRLHHRLITNGTRAGMTVDSEIRKIEAPEPLQLQGKNLRKGGSDATHVGSVDSGGEDALGWNGIEGKSKAGDGLVGEREAEGWRMVDSEDVKEAKESDEVRIEETVADEKIEEGLAVDASVSRSEEAIEVQGLNTLGAESADNPGVPEQRLDSVDSRPSDEPEFYEQARQESQQFVAGSYESSADSFAVPLTHDGQSNWTTRDVVCEPEGEEDGNVQADLIDGRPTQDPASSPSQDSEEREESTEQTDESSNDGGDEKEEEELEGDVNIPRDSPEAMEDERGGEEELGGDARGMENEGVFALNIEVEEMEGRISDSPPSAPAEPTIPTTGGRHLHPRFLPRFNTSPNLVVPKITKNWTLGGLTNFFHPEHADDHANGGGEEGAESSPNSQKHGGNGSGEDNNNEDESASDTNRSKAAAANVYSVRSGFKASPVSRKPRRVMTEMNLADTLASAHHPQSQHRGSVSSSNLGARSITPTPSIAASTSTIITPPTSGPAAKILGTTLTPLDTNVPFVPILPHHRNSTSAKKHHHHHHHNTLSVRDVERAFDATRDHDLVPVVHIRVADWRAEYREDRREDLLHMRLRVKDEEQYKRLMRLLQEFQ